MKSEYDVFLSHNSRDKRAVRRVAQLLSAHSLSVWLDEWELAPGTPWQSAIEDIIHIVPAALILVGNDGVGPWEEPEMRACLKQFVERRMVVIPVLLPSNAECPKLPLFLQDLTWVDMRKGLTQENLRRLVWGITGDKYFDVGKLFSLYVSYDRRNMRWVGDRPRDLVPTLNREFKELGFSADIPQGQDESSVDDLVIADCVLLLIDDGYLESEFVRQFELPLIKDRISRGSPVKAVLVGECSWQEHDLIRELGVIQPVPLSATQMNDEEWMYSIHAIKLELWPILLEKMHELGFDPNDSLNITIDVSGQYKSYLSQGRLPATKIGDLLKAGRNKFKHYLVAGDLHLFLDEYMEAIERQLVRTFKWSAQRAYSAAFVIQELLANAAEHGCLRKADKEIELTLRLGHGGARLDIRVRDPGIGFSLEDALLKNEANEIPHGLSLVQGLVMQMLTNEKGNEVIAVVSRSRPRLRRQTYSHACSILATYNGVEKESHSLPILTNVDVERHDKQTFIGTFVEKDLLFEYDVKAMRDDLLKLPEHCQYLILDFFHVTNISSAMMGVLVILHKKCQELQTGLCCAAFPERFEEVFQTQKFGQIISCYETLESAILAVKETKELLR